MVYATRSDRPIISSKPLKRTRKKGRLEQIKEFLSGNNNIFQDDTSNEIMEIKVKKDK